MNMRMKCLQTDEKKMQQITSVSGRVLQNRTEQNSRRSDNSIKMTFALYIQRLKGQDETFFIDSNSP